jgi:flagellar biosynthesis/type III secretory pathway protein FliH
LQGEAYINRNNPLGYALAALMRPPRGIDRVAWKLSCLRGILEHESHQARQSVLAMCVNRYLPLAEAEQRRLEMMLSTDPRIEKELEELVAAWKQEERERMIREAQAEGLEKGLEKGRAAGISEGEKRGLLYLLAMRFPNQPIPDELHDTIMSIGSEEELLKWYRLAYEAESIIALLPDKSGNGHGA